MTQEAAGWAVGRDPLNIAAFHRDCPLETRLKSGVELALWDICGKALGVPVSVLLGGVIRPRIELAACMGIQSYQRAGEIAAHYVELGYTTLKTKAGLERAFKKLDTIKAQVQWWEAGAQAPEWLVSGEVTLAMAYSGRVINARKEGKPLGLIWDHNIYATDSWVIVKGAPNIDTAYAALKWFSQPEPQVVFSRLFPYGPTNAKAADLLDAKLLADVPAGANIATALHSGSDDAISFWVDNLEEVTERWNAWVGK